MTQVRTTRLHTARRRLASPLVALTMVATLALSGCASAPENPTDAGGTSALIPAATKSPSATPSPAVRPSAIVVGMTSLTVLDSAGAVIDELSYRTSGIDVAEKLTKIFGTSPVITDTDGNFEVWPARNYDWSGFTLHDEMRLDPSKAVWYEYYVSVAVPSINGVELRTPAGVKVGTPESNVVYDSDRYLTSWDGQTCGTEALFSDDGNINNAVYLYICSSDESALVTNFFVPAQLQV